MSSKSKMNKHPAHDIIQYTGLQEFCQFPILKRLGTRTYWPVHLSAKNKKKKCQHRS